MFNRKIGMKYHLSCDFSFILVVSDLGFSFVAILLSLMKKSMKQMVFL